MFLGSPLVGGSRSLFNFAVDSPSSPLYLVVLILRHVAVATYDTESYIQPGSSHQTLQTALIINIIHNSTTEKAKATQCSVATSNDNL
jgi:hypothetical protein